MKSVVLDASALMTFFLGRPGADRVKELILAAAEGKRELLMSVVNWGEVHYSIWHTSGEAIAHKKMAEIAQLPIGIVPADAEQTRLAAEFKARYSLPYADSFAAALSKLKRAALVTSDPEFAKVGETLRLVRLNE